jgi:type II secretory pathway pseudopilin PulG
MNIEYGRRPLHKRISTQETGPRGGPEKVRAGLRKYSLEAKLKIEIQKSTKLAFTLIELMAATTVLSLVLLMMVGMQDQMSKAWSNANRRTDATREARAACRLMARDFSYFLTRGTNTSRNIMRAPSVIGSPVPFYYFSGTGSIPSASLTMPTNIVTNSSYIFGVFPKKKSSPKDSDFALAGYYIAQTTTNNINGFRVTNCNLHRYYRTSNDAVTAFSSWISNPTQPNNLFSGISSTNDEILARNACNLSIKVYGSTNSKNGLIYSNDYGSSGNGIYFGNKIHVELSLYPDEVAQKLPNIAAWTNVANIQKSARTFEFNVDWPDSKE